MTTYKIQRHESIGAYARFIEDNHETTDLGELSDRGEPGEHDYEWAGGCTLAQACEWARFGGWQAEELPNLTGLFDKVEASLRGFIADTMTRDLTYVGEEADVNLFLEGEPECVYGWVPVEDQVQKHVITCVLSHSVGAGVSAAELAARGRGAIALIRALALLGFELELWSEVTVAPGGEPPSGKGVDFHSTLVRLHGAGEALDVDALEFSFGHPAWLRRMMFAAAECEPTVVRKRFGFHKGRGYGRPSGLHHTESLGADIELDLGRAWFGGGRGRDGSASAEDVARWVVDQLVEAGAISQEDADEWSAS